MRPTLLCALPLILAANVFAQAAPPDTIIKKEQLAAGVWLFRAPSDLDMWTASNSVVIINDDDVTVFDTHTRPVTNQRVIAEIRRLTSKPVRTLINSHWHQDHWSGNDEYQRAFPGLRIIATTESRDYMARLSSAWFTEGSAASVTRQRASLDSAIRTGRQSDSTPLTPELRRRREAELAELAAFWRDVAGIRRVLPNTVYHDTMILWSGSREFRLYSASGDASGSTILHLPAERIAVMGDVLVSPEDGQGPPPWTTNSYRIRPWANSLRAIEALDLAVVVPGQGPALQGKSYLSATVELFTTLIHQVDSALRGGAVTLEQAQAAVSVDGIAARYPGFSAAAAPYRRWIGNLTRKAYQESYDGAGRGL